MSWGDGLFTIPVAKMLFNDTGINSGRRGRGAATPRDGGPETGVFSPQRPQGYEGD